MDLGPRTFFLEAVDAERRARVLGCGGLIAVLLGVLVGRRPAPVVRAAVARAMQVLPTSAVVGTVGGFVDEADRPGQETPAASLHEPAGRTRRRATTATAAEALFLGVVGVADPLFDRTTGTLRHDRATVATGAGRAGGLLLALAGRAALDRARVGSWERRHGRQLLRERPTGARRLAGVALGALTGALMAARRPTWATSD